MGLPKELIKERITFKVNRIVTQAAIDQIFRLATQEEELAKYPATWWQFFKEAYFPKWLLRKFPVQYEEIWAVRKYPEINIPDLGSEYVHFKIIDIDGIERLRTIQEKER